MLSLAKIFEETVELDEAEVYKRPVKISALGGQKNHAIIEKKGVIVAVGMSEKDAKKQKKFGQSSQTLPGAKVGQMVKEDLEESRKRIGIKTIKFAKILGLSKDAKDVFASAINMSQTAGVPGMDAPLATADNLQKFSDGDFVGALVYLRKNSSKLPAGGRKYAKKSSMLWGMKSLRCEARKRG